jgi:hypothetical protein
MDRYGFILPVGATAYRSLDNGCDMMAHAETNL